MNQSTFIPNILWNTDWVSLPRCPGKFCGRVGNRSECGACSWGTRVTNQPESRPSQCEPCLTPPDFHGWLYLSFTAVLPIIIFFLLPPNSRTNQTSVPRRVRPPPKIASAVDESHSSPILSHSPVVVESNQCVFRSFFLPLACLLIHVITALFSLLLFSPLGSINIYSCVPQTLDEFYAVLVAAPGCSSEIVFPFISLPLTYYGLSALVCLVVYSFILCCVHQAKTWRQVAYHALYTYPVLCLFICVFGGLLYFSFPYVLLLLALVHSVYRFPVLFDYCVQPADGTLLPLCNPSMLFRALFTNGERYFPTLLVSIFCYAYGLIALTHSISFWAVLLAPAPFLFYAVTLPFTHPFVTFDGDYAFSLATARCPPDRSASRTILRKQDGVTTESEGARTERVI
ncbi:JNK1/MAPK8-associated membrane protein [Fasciola gigantica]|uniref:JNK1/MAPK8-associated membrane protein n=1 Tax=Fasciola gigantica TaxID=46835 RepID=A0A504Y7C4_FASGI|nr:JNK1/MAPK8-associated membrane protein [Fasciola gigantica]